MTDQTGRSIEWSSTLETGVDKIDQQHLELVRGANQVIAFIEQREPADVLCIAFAGLMDLAVRHFDYEEQVMEANGYLHLRSHRAAHNADLRHLVRLSAQVRAGEADGALAFQALSDWLLEHILQHDMTAIPIFKHAEAG